MTRSREENEGERDDEAERCAREPARTQTGERRPKEIGGVDGPEPTRYGDWERNGRCTDF